MQFGAFGQDAIDNKAFLARGKLAMPVLAIGGEASFGTLMATVMQLAATGRFIRLRRIETVVGISVSLIARNQ